MSSQPSVFWSKFDPTVTKPLTFKPIKTINNNVHVRNVKIYHGMYTEKEFWSTIELLEEFSRRVKLSDEADAAD